MKGTNRSWTYDIGVRPVQGKSGRWEAFAPDLPGFRVETDSNTTAFQSARQSILDHLTSLLAAGEALPVPKEDGAYMDDDQYPMVFWHFLKVNLGPRPEEVPAVEPVFPRFMGNGEWQNLDLD